MRSLQARLGTNMVLMLTLVFALQWLLVALAMRTVIEEHVASRLAHDADSLLAALDPQARTFAGLPEGLRYDQPYSGRYFQVSGAGLNLRSRSLWDETLDLPAVQPGDERRLRLPGPQDQRLLVLIRGYSKRGHDVQIATAEDLRPIQQQLARYRLGYLALSGGALVVLIILQHRGLQRALRPLAELRTDLAGLAQGTRHRLDEGVPEEVQPLTRELNRLLDVLGRRLAASRLAIGNLAHALKTPITLLGQLAASDEAPDAVRERLLRHTREIDQLVDRELRRGRLAGGGPGGRRFDPARDLQELIDILRQMHAERDLAVTLRVSPDAASAADREDMLELFGNLIDNACKWARSRVRVEASGDGGALNVSIEDDGPGCPPDRIADIAERGVRLDENTPGHGLGLAIARDVVDAYDGTLVIDASPELSGMRVRITLPAAPPGY